MDKLYHTVWWLGPIYTAARGLKEGVVTPRRTARVPLSGRIPFTYYTLTLICWLGVGATMEDTTYLSIRRRLGKTHLHGSSERRERLRGSSMTRLSPRLPFPFFHTYPNFLPLALGSLWTIHLTRLYGGWVTNLHVSMGRREDVGALRIQQAHVTPLGSNTRSLFHSYTHSLALA